MKKSNAGVFASSLGSIKRAGDGPHLGVLDGWRGLSILFVLAAHLLPLGKKEWQVNSSAGILGMVLFFILSGFLITSSFFKEKNVVVFFTRRFFRVIPLAWLYLAIALLISTASTSAWMAHFFFYANLPPKELLPLTDHMWSLCVELQFYLAIGLFVAMAGSRALILLPVFCLAITGLRVWDGIYASSITYYRIDEILAGASLALVYHEKWGFWVREKIKSVPQWLMVFLLLLSCMPQGEFVNYFRPYFAAILVGSTILNSDTWLSRKICNKYFAFLAAISYSLYVIHPMLASSWLGSGDVYIKYAKRPLLFLALFFLAYISTNYYEKRLIQLGKSVVAKIKEKYN
jgi:peptidoglycan/LPS O-acetylase OafA/YrhL